jgi:hypothetical protein
VPRRATLFRPPVHPLSLSGAPQVKPLLPVR